MEHDRGRLEPDDDPPGPKRHRLQLHRIQIEQLDAGIDRGGVVEIDDRNRRKVAVGRGPFKSIFSGIR